MLLGAPALLTIASLLTFWPARRAAPVLRIAGLVTLLLLYGTAVAEEDPGQPLLRGLVLLVLVGAWLWLPRLPRREAIVAGAVVASVGLLSLPIAAALDGDRPWWDYRAWDWFGNGKVITFDWNHSYGPLDWSRAGATVLNVKSDRPHYWKAETLDGFDGLRWVRTPALDEARYGPEVAFTRSSIRGPLGLQRVQPGVGRAHPLHGPLAVIAVRGRRGRGARRGRDTDATLELRRHDAALRRQAARGGADLLGARIRAEPDEGADGGNAGGLPGRPRALHGDPAAEPGRVRDADASRAVAR